MGYNLGPLGQQSTVSAVLVLVGLLSVASALYTVGRVLLSVFVLPGQPVRGEQPLSQHLLTV